MGLFFVNFSHASKEIDDEDKSPSSSFQFLSPPQFENKNDNDLAILLNNANKEDEKSQNEFVSRYYWKFLDSFRSNIFSDMQLVNNSILSCASWKNIEERAIEDPRYAFILIISYAKYQQFNGLYVPSHLHKHFNNLPQFCKEIQKKLSPENPADQFTLGLLSYFFAYASTRPFGLEAKPEEVRHQAFEYFTKAANQGHPHANVILGLSCYSGIHPKEERSGRNPVTALRYFFKIKNTVTAQEAIKDLLPRNGRIYKSLPQKESVFQEELAGIKLKLGLLLGEHSLQVELNNPEGKFSEHQFAIHELSLSYKNVVEVEEEAIRMIKSLQKTTPGFMMNAFTIGRVNHERIKHCIERQSNPPFISIHNIDKINFITIGEENVRQVGQFLIYVNEVEDKFQKAESVLQEDCESYKMRLKLYFAHLKEQRLLCIESQKKSKNDPSPLNEEDFNKKAQKFKKIQNKYEKKKKHLEPVINKIETEIINLIEVKNAIKELIFKTSNSRNLDFLKENPFLGYAD